MNRIITISREFGSGGREVGKRLADALGCAYYDSEIEAGLARQMNLDQGYVARAIGNGILTSIPLHFGRTISSPSLYKQQVDILVEKQKLLKELAAASDCVIVGRAADVILSGDDPLKLFVYADMDHKVARCQQYEEAGRLSPPASWSGRSNGWTPAGPSTTVCSPICAGATRQATTCASTPPAWRSSS